MSSTNNPSKSSGQSLNEKVQEIWNRREQGMVLPEDMFANLPLTPEQIQYLLLRYPYLQIVSLDAEIFYDDGPKIQESVAGWPIHDYGDAISSSLGLRLFLSGHLGEVVAASDDEGEGGKGGEGIPGLKPGVGTVVKQAYDTAYQMVEMAEQKDWPGFIIVSGTDSMRWAAWMAAQDIGLKVENYSPTAKEKAKRERLRRQVAPSVDQHMPG